MPPAFDQAEDRGSPAAAGKQPLRTPQGASGRLTRENTTFTNSMLRTWGVAGPVFLSLFLLVLLLLILCRLLLILLLLLLLLRLPSQELSSGSCTDLFM